MKALIQKIVEVSKKANPPAEGDYTGENGLLYCGKCHTPRQHIFMADGISYRVSCMCDCRKAEEEAQEKAEKERKHQERVSRLREHGNVSPRMNFDAAKDIKPLQICRRYARKWEKMRDENIGLLLWGNVGTGKTYAAHCICNEVVKTETPVYITSLSKILSGSFDKTEEISRIRWTPLVVFDDLGVERGSDYAMETVFTLINERYEAKKPLIVTTNITLEKLRNPVDLKYSRIYDRILEMCVPIEFKGVSMRGNISKEKLAIMAELTDDD